MSLSRRRAPLAPVLTCALAAALVSTAIAAAQGPAPPPGPPPGGGADLPVPPGTAAPLVPPGTPAAVPATATGPGLASGSDVALNRKARTLSVPLACQAGGTIRLSVRAAAKGVIAHGPYTCRASRATAKVRVSPRIAKRLTKLRRAVATATVTQRGKATKMSFMVRVGGAATPVKGFWTDGHLQCAAADGTPTAYLVEPDFTTATPTTISTRGWVAWWTAAGGWHWLGVAGENASRWDTWSATVGGIAQFHPAGAAMPTPWTWGPITVPTGAGIVTVGVYEIVYWVGGRPDYQWQYVNAGTTGAAAAGGGTLYCRY
jgi:hypothetical protein